MGLFFSAHNGEACALFTLHQEQSTRPPASIHRAPDAAVC